MKLGYINRCKPERVIDGDTLVVDIDLGYGIYAVKTIRLAGIDTSELHSKDLIEHEKAVKAKRRVEEWISESFINSGLDYVHFLTIETHKKGSFGRWISDIRNNDGESICALLLAEGLATEYKRGK